MKKLSVIYMLLFVTATTLAQSKSFDDFAKQQTQKFDTFKSEKQAQFDAFRKAQNERYADFMAHSWEPMQALPPLTDKKEEQPIVPIVLEQPTNTATNSMAEVLEAIPVTQEIITIPQPLPQPDPIAPVVPNETLPYKIVSISYYGTLISIGFPATDNFKIKSLSEKDLSNAWKHLSDEKYDITLNNVLKVRDDLALCDWAYIDMLQAISEKQYGKTNEAVMMQAFLLAQSSYKVRMAYGEDKLFILLASQYGIYGMGRCIVEDQEFFLLNCKLNNFKVCKAFFEKEKAISLQLRHEQKFDIAPTSPRKLTSTYGIATSVTLNQNEIEFFNNYPTAYIGGDVKTKWAVYANTPLSQSITKTLYPALKKSIEGLNERDAVNKILNFVQTAFNYKTDNDVWGGDRVFFAAETLYYPHSDCEDRAVLFSRLVRDIVGNDVVLLYYPGHLAAAVAFNQEVNGDYLMYKNRRYIVCDPTYIRGQVGQTPEQLRTVKAQIIALNK